MRQTEHLFAISCAGPFHNLHITKHTLHKYHITKVPRLT